ncbi:MAG: hypothetical protein K5829_09400 [Treponema sp.]|nr:hypothetical protein [Treponema sp.]
MFNKSCVFALVYCASSVLFAQNFDGFGQIPDESIPELSAVKEITEDENFEKLELLSEKSDESVFYVKEGVSVEVKDSSFSKSGGASSNNGQSNFYGLNAVILSNGILNLNNVNVFSDADGANAVFSSGDSALIKIDGITIETKNNSSRGLDATYGGSIFASNVNIKTLGQHCAAFATDRGEGLVDVIYGSAYTYGQGSPVIYSTGDIRVKNLVATADVSEIAVIEGKNQITIRNSILKGGSKSGRECGSAIMLYQSMSGDAAQGTSVFTSEDSTFMSTSDGPFFYVTNTNAKINIKNSIIKNESGILIKASGNNSERGWGKKGNNGGILEFESENQILNGSIICDSISSINLNFNKGTKFYGSINTDKGGYVNLTLEKNAELFLTEDSYVNVLKLKNKKGSNISSSGYTLYYNKNAAENKYLKGKTIRLKNGGMIVGIEYEAKVSSSKDMGQPRDDKKGKGPGQGNNNKSMGKVKAEEFSGTIIYNESEEVCSLLINEELSYKIKIQENDFMGKELPEFGNGVPDGAFMKGPEGGMPGKAGKDGKDGKDGKPGEKRQPPKRVTLEDLIKLNGKEVLIKGIVENDTLLIFEIEEK